VSTFASRADAGLRNETSRRAVRIATDHFPEARARGLADLVNPDELRDAARAIRARCLARIDELLAQFADNLESRGVHVFWADDAAEATAYVREVARRRGARLVVKSKSMATEEIELNHVLEADGLRVVETDLGEYIVQVAGEPPSHILAPAIHRDRYGVAEVLSKDAGRTLDPDPQALMAYARGKLREDFLAGDLGVSGVNFGVAETGSIVMVTNEGNGRMVTSLPPAHVAVMGMERIVGTWEELDVLLTLLPRSATGQPTTVYTSILSGPRGAGEADGPEEMHVVILDNGRSSILGTEYREILHCIRCGACLNVCPVYRNVGGYAYGAVYGGPVGAVLTPLLRNDRGDLAEASSLCAACHEVCPVRIPIQDLLLKLRSRGRHPRSQRIGFKAWSWLWSSPRGYRLTSRAAARVGGLAARLPGPLASWTATREPPQVPRRSYLEGLRKS
jgi:L-lactate dehydrogenase complex protein LldF